MNRLIKGLTELSPPRSAILKMGTNLKPKFRFWSPAMYVAIFSLLIQQAFIPCFASDLPKITKLEPTTALRGTEVTVTGEGFSEIPEDNILLVEGRGEVGVTWIEQPPEPNKKYDKVRGRFVSDRQLDFWGIPKGLRVVANKNTKRKFEKRI